MKQYIFTEEQIAELVDESAQHWAGYIEQMAAEFDKTPGISPRRVCETLAKSIRMSGGHTKKELMN